MTTIEKIVEYFIENDDILTEVIEDLDSWNGYLNDGRYYPMEYLTEFYSSCDPIELLQRAYFGNDLDNWYTDAAGNRIYDSFNPNRDYFKYNGYGNLVSTNYRNYSDHNDKYLIESLCDNRSHIDSIDKYEELGSLFDELDGSALDRAFDRFCENTSDCDNCPYRNCKSLSECKAAFERDNKEV